MRPSVLLLASLTACSAGSTPHVRPAPAPAIPPVSGPVQTAFALRYVEIAAGTGSPAQARQCYYAHYTGWLTDGTKFDSSRDTARDGTPRTPIAFPQGARRVIAGWDAGFEGMRVGGRRRLIIPYQLAYGEAGRPPVIPPRSELIFDVELMAVADTLPSPGAARGAPPRCAPWPEVAAAMAQPVEYTSPAGVTYRALPDTGAVARAELALQANRSSVDLHLALGLAQSGARRYREAIETFSWGIRLAPDNAMLYRWRGHRYLSTRQFDRALADLTHALELDRDNYGALYHLGIVRFVLGEFDEAAALFARAIPLAPDAGELAGSVDWRWMSLMRAGRAAEAQAMLEARPDSLPVANEYARRLRMYRGEIAVNDLVSPADTGDVARATLHFGRGNWFLVRGDTARARREFQAAVASGGWPAFGFIAAEQELERMGN